MGFAAQSCKIGKGCSLPLQHPSKMPLAHRLKCATLFNKRSIVPKITCQFCFTTKKVKTRTNHYYYPRRCYNGSCDGGYKVEDKEVIVPKRWREFEGKFDLVSGSRVVQYACPECIASTKDAHEQNRIKAKAALKTAKKKHKHFLANEWRMLDSLIQEKERTYRSMHNNKRTYPLRKDPFFIKWQQAAGKVQSLKNKEWGLRDAINIAKEQVTDWDAKRLTNAIPVLQAMHTG